LKPITRNPQRGSAKPESGMKFVKTTCVHNSDAHCSKSPILFLHGAPDSPAIWEAYIQDTKSWAQNRQIFTLETPNSVSNPVEPPSLKELFGGAIYDEIAASILSRIIESPSGKVVIVAHDFGATYAWNFVRNNISIANQHIEQMVSFSVGSSFRYDVWEHGPNALTWCYAILPALVFFCPFFPLKYLFWWIWRSIGFPGDYLPSEIDLHPYWYAPFFVFRMLFDFFFGMLHTGLGFVDFKFPVFFLRSRIDSIASNDRFEKLLERRGDCKLKILPFSATHWFLFHHSDVIMPEFRAFLRKRKE